MAVPQKNGHTNTEAAPHLKTNLRLLWSRTQVNQLLRMRGQVGHFRNGLFLLRCNMYNHSVAWGHSSSWATVWWNTESHPRIMAVIQNNDLFRFPLQNMNQMPENFPCKCCNLESYIMHPPSHSQYSGQLKGKETLGFTSTETIKAYLGRGSLCVCVGGGGDKEFCI